MKKAEPYIEITIKNKELLEWKWVKINSNSAYISHEDGTKHYTIDARPFVSLLQKYKPIMDKYVANTLNKDTLSFIKYHYDNNIIEFSFEYTDTDILNLAYSLHDEFKNVIEENQQDYVVLEKEICDSITTLPPQSKIVLEEYFEKYGIISTSNKEFLTKYIIKNLSQHYKVKRRKFFLKSPYFTIKKIN